MLRKHKLSTIKVITSKDLIDSYISHNEFVSVNNVFREQYETNKTNKKILKLLCNTEYKNNGNELCQL